MGLLIAEVPPDEAPGDGGANANTNANANANDDVAVAGGYPGTGGEGGAAAAVQAGRRMLLLHPSFPPGQAAGGSPSQQLPGKMGDYGSDGGGDGESGEFGWANHRPPPPVPVRVRPWPGPLGEGRGPALVDVAHWSAPIVRAQRARYGRLASRHRGSQSRRPRRRASDGGASPSLPGGGGGGGGTSFSSEGNQEACGGSRWTDYYSAREVLDVIRKDLRRLPPDHVDQYHRRRMRMGAGGGGNGNGNGNGGGNGNGNGSDPFGGDDESGGDECGIDEEEGREGDDDDDDDAVARRDLRRSREERASLLGEVLLVYAREHQALGYRQGMHEILSYVLLALEADLEDAAEAEGSSGDGGGDGGGDRGAPTALLFRPDRIRHDLYSIFEAIMSRLSPAYDTQETQGTPPPGDRGGPSPPGTPPPPGSSSSSAPLSPMERMGDSILSKVRDVAGDGSLHRAVTELGVPPQLYCTRWVRLMFAREVAHQRDVMELWDAFFDQAAEEEVAALAGGDRHGGRPAMGGMGDPDAPGDEWTASSAAFMNILESAAASMILLVRDRLVSTSNGGTARTPGLGQPGTTNDGIHALMNYPPLQKAAFLTDVLDTIIWQQRRDRRVVRRGRSSKGDSGALARPRSRSNSVSKFFGIGAVVRADPLHHSPTESRIPLPGPGSIRQMLGGLTVLAPIAADGSASQASASGDDLKPMPPKDSTRLLAQVPRKEARLPQGKARLEISSASRGPPTASTPLPAGEGTRLQPSNEDLAAELGASVQTIMVFLKELSPKGTSQSNGDGTLDQHKAVPNEVWAALLNVNNVGKSLMAKEDESTIKE